MSAETTMVLPDRIRTGENAQTRVAVRAGMVREYAAAMTEQLVDGGLRFPPVILFTDGIDHWLGDGFHRLVAARKAGRP